MVGPEINHVHPDDIALCRLALEVGRDRHPVLHRPVSQRRARSMAGEGGIGRVNGRNLIKGVGDFVDSF